MKTLSCSKLTKTYGGQTEGVLALNSFTYSFPNKGLVSILGKSGSGKSTLLCLLSLMEKPTAGKVYFKGDDINALPDKAKNRFLRDETSFIFQHYGLFDKETVLENVILPLLMKGYSRKKAIKKAETILLRFGLKGFARREVATLSGGEKQRVAICRALIKKPRIIFADEPTGALDARNGEEVMKMLSSASKSALVIMVSHNKELVEAYSDRILHLKDGKLVSEEKLKTEEGVEEEKTNTGTSSFWVLRFFAKYLKEDFRRNILTGLSGIIGCLSILLSFGYLTCSKEAMQRKRGETLEYLSANISKKEIINYGNSPVSLSREKRPTIEEINDRLGSLNYSVHPDYSVFFPLSPLYGFDNEEYSDVSFVSIYDSSLEEYGKNLLIEGEASLEQGICYVNDVFAKSHPSPIGKEVVVDLTVPLDNGFIHDEVKIYYRFAIKGIIGEFSYMNTPKVYYPYGLVENELRKTILENHSENLGKKINALDALELGLANENSKKVFFHDPNEMDLVYNKIKEENNIVISSNAFMVFDSFSSLSEAFSLCLWLLFAISLFGVIGINAMSFLSLFLKRRKEVALLFSLGAKKSEVMTPFLLESGITSTLYCLLSIALFHPLKLLFNLLLQNYFGIGDLINIPSFGPSVSGPVFLALFLAINVFIALFSGSMPILFSLRKGLRKELRDE